MISGKLPSFVRHAGSQRAEWDEAPLSSGDYTAASAALLQALATRTLEPVDVWPASWFEPAEAVEPRSMAFPVVPAASDRDLSRLPNWPLALTFEQALQFTNLSAAELRRQLKSRRVAGRAVGPRGSMLIHRRALEAIMDAIFDPEGAQEEDFDFGDD